MAQGPRPSRLKAWIQGKNEIRAVRDYKYCIILPNDSWKLKWDFLISLLIMATAIYTPYRLAYEETTSTAWLVIELLVDSLFLVDIILSFFAAYFDDFDVLVDKRSKIICGYLKFWFIVDFVSILPISLILDNTSPQMNDLARVARLSRLYKLIKMVKLLKMTRLLK